MTSNTTSTVLPFLKRRWVKITLLSLGLLLALVFLVPLGARYYLTDWLVKNGADQAHIERLWFNPFLGKLTLGGVTVESGGKPRLQNADMELDLHIRSLLNKDIRIEHGKYVGLLIDLEQYPDGRWRYGSYTISEGKKETEQRNTEDVSSGWAFLADSVILEKCSVHLTTPDLKLQLDIEMAELKRFTTHQGDQTGTFRLEGKLNGEKIELQLDTLRVAPDLQIEADVFLEKVVFMDIGRLVEEVLPTFDGEAGLKGKILFSNSEKNGMGVRFNGKIGITSPHIGMGNLNTQASKLGWHGTIDYRAPQNGPMTVETDGVLSSLDYALQLPATSFTHDDKLVELSGKTVVEIQEEVVVKNKGELRIEGINLGLPALTLSEDTLLWSGEVTYNSNAEGAGNHVQASGVLKLGPFQYTGGEPGSVIEAGLEGLSWDGAVIYGQQNENNGSVVKLDGVLEGQGLAAFLEQQEMTFSQQFCRISSESQLLLGEKTDITGDASFLLDNFQMLAGEEKQPMITLQRLEVEELKGLGGKQIAFRELIAEKLTTQVKGDFPLDITVPKISLAEFSTEDLASIHVETVGLTQPKIVSLTNGKILLDLEKINAKQTDYGASGEVNCSGVDFQNLVFLEADEVENQKPGLSIKNAILSDISWSREGGFSGQHLEFTDLVTTIVRDKKGQININKRLAEMRINNQDHTEVHNSVPNSDAAVDSNNEEGDKEAEDDSTPIRLGKVIVSGQSNIIFEDYTLAVPYITDLVITNFELDELDSTLPELKTSVILQGELEKRAPVNLQGHVSPFKKPLAMDLKVSLKNYPLSSLSAYTVQSVGTALASGQLAFKSTVNLADDNLDMVNNVVLKKLKTKKISEELARELDNQLPIPLNSALSLLRDSKDNIDLDIPLKGPVDNLGVGISDVLITALSKAIVPAASGYLMYALGPYGALAYVGMKVGENLLQVDLPPVEFEPGSSDLTSEHHDYLTRIGKILQDRPDPDIQLCPRVGSWELMKEEEIAAVKGSTVPLKDEYLDILDTLGRSRAEAVQNYLVNAHAIDKNRLLICETLIEDTKSTIPALLLNM